MFTHPKPLSIFPGKTAFNAVDHHRSDRLFAAASNTLKIWDETRTSSISSPSRPPSKPLLLSSSIPLKLPLLHHVALTAHSLCMISVHPKLNAVSSCISN
ncbi:Protein sof1 [Leucoagaricus gongylophorus]